MAQPSPPRRWVIYLLALLLAALAAIATGDALTWYGRPFGGVLVSSEMEISSTGLPSWSGPRQGLRFPDHILAVDGEDLTAPGRDPPTRRWDRAVQNAAGTGRVHARVATRSGIRDVDLDVEPLSPLAWWVNAGALLIIGALYGLVGLVALATSRGPGLGRTLAKTALSASLFLLIFFDSRAGHIFTPWSHVVLPILPVTFVALALRLPDDVPIVKRSPWLLVALDFVGLGGAAAMLGLQLAGHSTELLREVSVLAFAGSQFFLVGTILVRFTLARGERRATIRTLLGAMLTAHIAIGLLLALVMVSARGATLAFFLTPVFALSPLATLFAFIRHDLWGSHTQLPRRLTRAGIAVFTCALAIAMGAALAASMGVAFRGALIAAGAGGVGAALLVNFALTASDRELFPSRAQYKPTIEQLSEELTSVASPSELARAIERTVRRWLPCEYVAFTAADPNQLADPRPESSTFKTTSEDDLKLPITFAGRSLGQLQLGRKRGGALFTSEDLDLLRTIANQAALALAYAHSYAELEQRRRQQVAAWRDERAALVETVAAEIAHEVRYPINFFRSIFARGTSSGKLDAEDIEIGCEEVGRLERLVAGLRRVVQHKLERRAVELTELASRVEVLLRDALGDRKLEVMVPAGLALRCNPDEATQMLVNLVANAIDATPRTEKIGLEWANTSKGGELVVWDEGPGFAGDPSQLFAPWFTTKPRGTGLGLAITHRLVRAHGWSIDAHRGERTTRFIIAISAADILDLATDKVQVA